MRIFSKLFSAPTTEIRQDLPPPGGYKPIQYARIPPKQYFSGKMLFLIFGVVHFTGCYIYMQHKRKLIRWEVENRSANLALMPMLMAERDRAYLKVLRKNRDHEEQLMKDVPGWEVGTYYGDKIFHTLDEDEWFDVTPDEYFAHARMMDATWSRNWWKQL